MEARKHNGLARHSRDATHRIRFKQKSSPQIPRGLPLDKLHCRTCNHHRNRQQYALCSCEGRCIRRYRLSCHFHGWTTHFKKSMKMYRAGAARRNESQRSSTPPCPTNKFPESFVPLQRLSADIRRSPTWPATVMRRPMTIADVQVKSISKELSAALHLTQYALPSLLRADARSKGMTTKRSLARRKLSKEISDCVAEPYRRHHEDERVAMFKALAVAHHEHVHAAPEPHIQRSAKLHHKPREQVVNLNLRVGNANVNRKNSEKRHADNVRHSREAKVAALRKRPRKRQRHSRRKREIAHIRACVHLGCHAGPFPGANRAQKTHQSNATKVVEPK